MHCGDGSRRVVVEDPHKVCIPLHAYALAQEGERHRVEGAPYFDVAIEMYGARPVAEEREGLSRARLQGALCSASTKWRHTCRRVVR